MPRNTYGRRYPHATTEARKHNCVMCHIVGMIAERAASGAEEWGTPHQMPALASHTEHEAEQIRDQLFLGRSCRKNKKHAGALSVSVTYLTPDGQLVNSPPARRDEGYVLVVRVWTRDAAYAEMSRRADAGVPFAYNPLKETT